MDIFKFRNPEHPMEMDHGELINNIRSKMWVERYRDPSDFELLADVSTGLHLTLPIGSFISHIDSTEIMIVENHEITEELDSPTEIKISGRSFDSFFENRIVGSNKPWPTEASATEEYFLSADLIWNQAVRMIQDHVETGMVFSADDAVPYLEIMTDITGTGESIDRYIPRGNLHAKLMELLEINSLGIKILRPGINSVLGFGPNIAVVVHAGEDLSQDVVFSYNVGEIEKADYFWSNRNLKTSALITGRWLETVAHLPFTGYNRRMMQIDASDLDKAYSAAPTGFTRDGILYDMNNRGLSVLARQKDIALIRAEPKRDSVFYKYRRDYKVGDVVTVEGQYNETASMRVTEYVEIEDENGESGYPTLSVVL